MDSNIDNISAIEPARIRDMTAADIKAIINGALALPPAAPPPGDGDVEMDGIAEPADDLFDIEEEPFAVPPTPHAAIIAAPVLVPIVAIQDPIEFNQPGYPAMKVTFDNLSHDTGNRRASLYCRNCDHDKDGARCRLYVNDIIY